MTKDSTQDPIALATYEDFGEGYAQAIETNAWNAHYERPSTLALLPNVRDMNVLDAGCGPGAYASWLVKNGAHVTAIDVSPAMVDLAKRRVGDSAEVITCDLAKTPLPLKSAFFQLIVCSLTIHYIQDLNALFREFHRLLRTSGQLVFSTHHPMVDYNSHPEGNYHSIELVEETWDTVGRPVKVRFYRRPISQLFMPLISAGFSIEVVDEGKPTQECKEKYPKAFAKLSSKPGFIFVRARKK